MELHIIFFIVAGLLIAVLIGSSILSNRREKSRVFSNTFSQRPPSTPINNTQSMQPNAQPVFEQQTQHSPEMASQPELDTQVSADIQRDVANSLSEIKIRIPGQEENHAAPDFLRTDNAPIYGQQAQQGAVYTQPAAEQQPAYTQEGYSAQNYAEPAHNQEPQVQQVQMVAEEPEQVEQPSPADMVMLYVVAAEGYQFNGEHVVQCLEALGFEYGEYQIFHRHKHLGNNNSPVIFSVANMMQPGVFDLDNIQNFATVGLVMFMHLPTEGNPMANLKLMLQSAERLAQSLNGFVLNERREIFDETSRLEYLKRVR